MESFFFSGRRYDDPLRVSRPPYVPASVQTRSALTRTEIPLRRTGPLARSASRILPRGRGSAVATRLGRRRTDENRQGRGVNLRSPGRRCSRERDPGRGGGRSRGTVGACPRTNPIPRWFLFADPQTGVAPGGPEAAMCVQGVDVHCVLQFTLIHAAGCALHRRTSRVIHRSKL